MMTLGTIMELLTLGLPPMGIYGTFLAGIVAVGLWLEIREAWEPDSVNRNLLDTADDPVADWKPALGRA